jgi:hypothetical protein
VDKVRRELANYQEFVTVSAQIVEVNEAIWAARPISAFADEPQTPTKPVGERGGSSARSRRSSPPR